MISILKLNNDLLQEMINYVDQRMPLEACGLLAGKEDRAEKMIGVLNQAQSPVRFVMDPLQQLGAFESIESEQMDLLAIYQEIALRVNETAGMDVDITITVKAVDGRKVSFELLARDGRRWLNDE